MSIQLDPEQWVDRHGDALYRYALVRLRDPALAEEIVQETFVSALQSRSRFSGQSSERTWLTAILKHKIVDHYRKAFREAPFDEAVESQLEHDEIFQQTGPWKDHFDFEKGPIDWTSDPEKTVHQSDFQRVLQACLSGLPARIAAAFTLREIDGLESDEICKVLEISSTNLWVMLHRARMQLRLCVETKWFRPATSGKWASQPALS
ncbi:MAG: sigma-70 family RNA polymerase sigma factor [Acidobacteriota bacterium]